MKRKKLPIYWICLGIYTVILLLLSRMFLAYTDKSLIRYENAQSETAMKNYMSDGTLMNYADIRTPQNAFEPADVYRDLYRRQFDGAGSCTFEKDAESYLTEEPVYDIFADETPVAKVTLSASNEHTIFGILTIMDWDIKKVEPVFAAQANDYFIRIPDSYTATVNGIALGEGNLTGNIIENPEFANVSEYVPMPVLTEYKVEGLVKEPEIKVYDAKGAEVSFTSDADGNVTADYQSSSEQMPEEYYAEAVKMAKAWENFLTRDLGGADNGLASIQKYLIKDSYYWNIACEYAHGVDITFISGHTLANPPYSDIEVKDYISYGEQCYSCHIYFEKNMVLASGARRTDTINSTFYFVKYDDSDDDLDNPHWAIVDMTADTN